MTVCHSRRTTETEPLWNGSMTTSVIFFSQMTFKFCSLDHLEYYMKPFLHFFSIYQADRVFAIKKKKKRKNRKLQTYSFSFGNPQLVDTIKGFSFKKQHKVKNSENETKLQHHFSLTKSYPSRGLPAQS